MVFEDLSADDMDDEAGLIMNAFFTQSEPSKAAGRACFIERTKLRVANRDAPVSKQAALAEAAAIREWERDLPAGPFCDVGQNPPSDADCAYGARTSSSCRPMRSFSLSISPNAQLIVYPDASHAA